jgi:hypothetical protein
MMNRVVNPTCSWWRLCIQPRRRSAFLPVTMARDDSGKAEVRRRQGEGFLFAWNPNAVVDDFRNASGYTDFTAASVTAHRQERR